MEDKDIQMLRDLSEEIDELYNSGKDKEGEEKLRQALEIAKNKNEAYYLFFQGEIAGYIENDINKLEICFNKALKFRINDFFLLRNKGVVLSKKGLLDEAIVCYNQALAVKPDDYDSLRQKGVTLYKKGLEDEAISYYDLALAIKPDDYNSLYNKGVSLSKKGLEDEAITYFDKALAVNPDDYNSLRDKGVSLSKKGLEDEAIACFNQALVVKPDDYNTQRQKGVTLSIKGLEDDAIVNYDKALVIKPDDYLSLSYKGVSLSKKGLKDEAIVYYEKALAIKPDDAYTLNKYSMICFNKREYSKAIELINHARELKPDDEDIISTYKYIIKYLESKQDKPHTPIKGSERQEEQGIPELRAVVQIVREKMHDRIDDFLKLMKETKDHRDKFLAKESLIKTDKSLLLILRKWNSYTPIIPAKPEDHYVGGGYFIFHKGKGTVIDPGYNFIENFYKAGGRIVDINNIVLTHAHDDHTNDFEALLSLVYQYNRKNDFNIDNVNYKRINIYMNTGSFMKFSGLLNLRGAEYINQVFTLTPKSQYTLDDDLVLEPLPAYHDELITKKYAVGLKLIFGSGESRKRIIITSDSGLFPKAINEPKDEERVDTKQKQIWELYPDARDANLLIVHIGSIKENEFKASLDTELDKVFYPNHLGVIGTSRVITALKPKLAIISEFGEELCNFQEDLIKLVNEIVKKFFGDGKEPIPKILPGDLPFIYNIFSEEAYCILSQKMVPVKELKFALPYPGRTKKFYYYSEKSQDDVLTKTGNMADAFEEMLEKREGLYFK